MGKLIDLSGQRFGDLTVVCRNYSDKSSRQHTLWWCECQCGNEIPARSEDLRKFRTNCGSCYKRKFKEENSNKYGRWLVLQRVSPPEGVSSKNAYMLCRCECGVEKPIQLRELRIGNSKSCGCLQKLPTGEAARNSLYLSYVKRSRERKLDWEIGKEEFSRITKKNCNYCGIKPNQVQKFGKNSRYVYNGIDRVDNTLGYTTENVVACCKICNFAKRTLSVDEFHDWAKRLYFSLRIHRI